ncbi:hypothetical protein HY357_00880, partial [Candidatus Roizmanbacteria bacterium]|nr:hypothetical protein [Candidatus Roizmanbacteria bacterium]
QQMHEVLREISMKAWEEIQNGKENPLEKLLLDSVELGKYLMPEELKKLLDPKSHVGNAPKKSKDLAGKIDNL